MFRYREESICAVVVVSMLLITPVSAIGMSSGSIPPSIDASSANPQLRWIGINTTAPYASLLDTMLEVDSDYCFSLQYNHTLGWYNCEFIVQAWYDYGMMGAASFPPAYTEDQRNLAFEIRCDATGASSVIFPASPVLEVTTGPAIIQLFQVNPQDPSGMQDEYRVYIPVRFGSQLRAADYDSMPPTFSGCNPDPNVALDNPFSWDFSITVRDMAQPSLQNTSYAEFGLLPDVSLTVAGDPTCAMPPGASAMMVPHSSIEYSANTPYWVNVSITDLYLNGIPGPYSIPAWNVAVMNIHPDANSAISEISSPTFFMGQNMDLCVWGQEGAPLLPADNGLVSAGPLMTDFTDPLAITELEWAIYLPVAIPEGVYWGTITVTIDAGGTTVEQDQSTFIVARTVFPMLWWIGFNETTGEPRLDQTIDAGKWYEITLEGNYSLGWDVCEITIEAWYDEGLIGGMSMYPPEITENENRAFKVVYDPASGASLLLYPPGSQVRLGTVRDENLWWPWLPGQEHHRVTIPVWLGPEMIAADGDGFVSGGPAFSNIKDFSLNDPNSWDFSITVSDIVNLASNTSYAEFGLDNSTTSYDIDMQVGWNLVSFPLALVDNSISNIMSQIPGKWDRVMYYDRSDLADPWKSCRPLGTANDLAYVDNTMGLWIHITQNCTLTIYGHLPVSSTVTQLRSGWNLVGYPSQTSRTVSQALSGTGYDRVECFTPTSPYVRAMTGSEIMAAGNGYWVHVPADAPWAVNW